MAIGLILLALLCRQIYRADRRHTRELVIRSSMDALQIVSAVLAARSRADRTGERIAWRAYQRQVVYGARLTRNSAFGWL